ncbi:DUF4142 domain-containing protein [Achromobacter aloeverae]|uniref:DUF305 domain-containing protein n=1 Tax=Achromobacter aloeverae TaxID=1750518 RepID=A0A4Q1HEV0_9BURK|nr:DUF4142 domain-containing protein [Achromobacter aloeverae]RXN85119.1 DUF305 domain-containing protein [Achromobacter aloeverae]
MDYPNETHRILLRKAALCAALLVSAGVGWPAHAAGPARQDQRFMEQAAQAGLFEIAASKLAGDHSDNGDVKRFAGMMVTDHGALAQDLRALADAKGVQLPQEPSRAQQSLLKQLQSSKGNKFDKTYAEKVAVSAHRDAVKLFTDAAKNARDADVKAFAGKGLPTLKRHLDDGRALRTTVSGNRPGGWVGEHPSPPAPANPPSTPAPSPSVPVSPVSPASPAAPANVVPGK